MSFFWKDLGWRCRTHRPLHTADSLCLLHLYQPIVGTTAISLYMTLYYQVPVHRAGFSDFHSHSYLLNLCRLTFDQLLESRYLLEGVGLISTFEIKDQEHGHFYEYELIPPLTPAKFFQSDVLSFALYNQIGKERFLAMKDWLTGGQEKEEKNQNTLTVNLTRSFQEVFKSLSPAELARAAELGKEAVGPVAKIDESLHEGKWPQLDGPDDGFALIKMRLSSLVDENAWTDELKRELREICFLYQLDDWDLLKALQNPYVTRNGQIDTDRLRSYIKSEYRLRFGDNPVVTRKPLKPSTSTDETPEAPKSHDEASLSEEEKHFKQLAQISPLELLSYYHKGTRIPDSDVELVERLIRQYGLPPAVINVLLEYVLLKYDYKLPRNLVEKIAGQWKRLGIETIQDALKQARKEIWEPKRKKTRLKGQAKQEEKLPQMLKKQFEAEAVSADSPAQQRETEDRQAQIRAKLRLMNEKFSAAQKENKNTP
ncbi:replication initiation and membrane attachment family protein [Thermoactinomyces sp. CICC 10523]|uniref:replication initiation and membrane attachment family protein n=1 Tax=Thermoactinomyces sp. CICC 10523 TaxID=2767428 RepID=UPI0018DDDC3F|nr:DnaD domain protein [Thermoactinomyces sp. CICC 10523]MBH8597557.1 DnaD domain protein [Thermoactinomyces sp. CICC 10523]